MSVETPLNLISSNRSLYDILWECDESALTTNVCKSMLVALPNVERYSAFDVIIRNSVSSTSTSRILLINDLPAQYEYTVGGGTTRSEYRTVRVISNGLRFGDVYKWGAIHTPSNNLQLCCYPLLIYGIR